MERLSKDSPGKHVVWRHEHPVIPKYKDNHIYGRVLEAHQEDGYFISKYQGYKHTPAHIKVYNIIKERDELKNPLSVSIRYRQYGDDDAPKHFDVIEHSLTPTPACKECVILDINNESDNMNDEERLQKIKEIEEELTLKNKKLESLESKIVSLEELVTKSAESIKVKDEQLEVDKTEKKELSDKVISFNDKLNEQIKMIDKLNEDMKLNELEPSIKKLIEIDGKSMEDLYRMKARSALADDKSFEEVKTFFAERIKDQESKNTPAVPKDIYDTALEAQMSDEELEDDKQKASRDSRAFANMPPEFFKRGDK